MRCGSCEKVACGLERLRTDVFFRLVRRFLDFVRMEVLSTLFVLAGYLSSDWNCGGVRGLCIRWRGYGTSVDRIVR